MWTDRIRKLKEGTEGLNYGRETVAFMVKRHFESAPAGPVRVLDIGLGTAVDVLNVTNALTDRKTDLYGLESYAPCVAAARAMGITVHALDAERNCYPFEEAFFDVVLANQVLEHTKEIFWILSEVSRILKPGGCLVVGVPNLASLHSRAMLLLGLQPSPIEVLGPHVRGYTRGGLARFLTAGGFFDLLEVKGANFYPFPASVAKPLSRLFPALSVSLFFRCRRTEKEGVFLEVLKDFSFETEYFRG